MSGREIDVENCCLEFRIEPDYCKVCIIPSSLCNVYHGGVISEHVFSGRLLKSDSTPINSQPIKLFLDDTQVTTLTTNSSSYIEFRRHFDPGNESDTYNVQVTCDGSGGQSATQN